MQWNDYVGGALPKETTHVQTLSNEVIDIAEFNQTGPRIVRYYGPALVVGEPQPADIPPIWPEHYATIALACADALARGALVTITHPQGYKRMGLGIPFRRSGGLTHEYRPIIVLDWINDQIVKSY